MEITVGAVKIIYSWNDADPDPTPSQHTTRGVKYLKLVGATKEFPAALEDTTQMNFTMGNIAVPNDATIYWCRTFRFNQPVTKQHVVRIGEYLDFMRPLLMRNLFQLQKCSHKGGRYLIIIMS